jgi:hypothetical protein
MKKILFVATFTLSNFLGFSQATGTASVFQLASISNTTYLIDTIGNTYNSWQCSANAASTAYLLKDGSIMRPYRVSNPSMNGGATGGGLQIIDWNNNILWDYLWSSPNHQQHHECIPIQQPNGTYNALLIAWERFDAATVQQAGGVNAEMWPTEIVEIEPLGASGGNIVWEWHAFDHVCQDNDTSLNNYFTDCTQHPELFDIGLFTPSGGGSQADWIHANGMDYSPLLDQIIFSSHFLHEIYIIDRSTTTAQAATHVGGNAGKGGDILYRWGNPYNYGGGNNTSWNSGGDRELHTVHGANFIDEGLPGQGNLMCFDNEATGPNGGSGDSRVVELQSPLNNYNYTSPWNQSPLWTYSDPGNFYANHLSGAFRTKKETTVATLGTSTYWREVDMQGNILYEYNHVSGGGGGGNNMAKTAIYELDYPGLIGVVSSVKNQNTQFELDVYPNPSNGKVNVLLPSTTTLPVEVEIYDVMGKKVSTHTATKKSFSLEINSLEKGIYFIKANTTDYNITKKLIVK